MTQQLKEKFQEMKKVSANGVNKKLVSEESTAGVWRLRILGTTIKEAGIKKWHS